MPQQPSESNINAFKFRSMTSASPIRFNPDTSDHMRAISFGSQSSLSSSMTPESITLTIKRVPDSSSATIEGNYRSTTTSDLASSRALTSNLPTSIPADPTVEQPTSTIEVPTPLSGPSLPYQAPNEGPKLPGKLTTQYVLPDGSVITGKGLGRGRPGVRRGPRKSKLPGEQSAESTPEPSMQTSQSSNTPTGTKRKRGDSDISNKQVGSLSSSLHSRESSIEITPAATQTRSGRQSQRPAPIIAPVATPTTASPVAKKTATPTAAAATPTLKTHPKIKRKVYRGKEQFALCEHCLRGFGPPGNVIVFCDACNKCWHQRCHQPPISNEIVADTKAEWFCAACDKILHGNKKAKKATPLLPKAPAVQPPIPPPQQKFGPPVVGAIALTPDQRKKYLESLSRDQLVNLLLRAGDLAPHMPIFETPIPDPRIGPPVQPQFTSDYVTPVLEAPGFSKVPPHDLPDEGYDDSYDEHAALYPKVGEGVKLPPERDDLNMLLEGPESRTFSHWVKGLPVKTVVDTVPLHLSQPRVPVQPQAPLKAKVQARK